MAALLIFLVSSYLYVDYSSKVMHNLILNRQFRSGIAVKIKPTRGLAFGTTADSLTIKEYQEITEMNWFPKVPNEALNIGYDYSYDGFLPDYVFTLIYYIPKEMKVDTIDFESGDFSRTQTFEIINNYKRVSYCEGEH